MPREHIRDKHGKVIGSYDRPMTRSEKEALGQLAGGIANAPGAAILIALGSMLAGVLFCGLIMFGFAFGEVFGNTVGRYVNRTQFLWIVVPIVLGVSGLLAHWGETRKKQQYLGIAALVFTIGGYVTFLLSMALPTR